MSVATPVPHIRLIFLLVMAAFFMDVIDASIVTVALPSIRTEFAASIPDSQWIYGAYAITVAGFLLLMGRAGDIYGQKKIFVAGLVIFSIASFTGGIAPSLLSLVKGPTGTRRWDIWSQYSQEDSQRAPLLAEH